MTMIWLSCKVNNFRYKLWRFSVIVRFLVTGECGLNCGIATFRKLDGTPFQQFVPEADCPVHDQQQKEYTDEKKKESASMV